MLLQKQPHNLMLFAIAYSAANRFHTRYPCRNVPFDRINKEAVVMQCTALYKELFLLPIDDVVNADFELQIRLHIIRAKCVREPHDRLLRQHLHTRIEYMKLRHGKHDLPVLIEQLCINLPAKLFTDIVKAAQGHILVRGTLMLHKNKMPPRKYK